MKFKIAKAKRLPGYLKWPAPIFTLWMALGAAAVYLSRIKNINPPPCIFKKITSMPCPTCGFTRGCLAIIQGRITTAFACNPMLFLAITVIATAIMLRILSGKKLYIACTSKEKKVLTISLILICLVNWIYVIIHTG